MSLLRKLGMPVSAFLKWLESFDSTSPADREVEQNRKQLAAERLRKSAR